jgi:hypothetical protein
MVRESDGEWITGDMYFYLNYTIMKRIVIVTLKNGRELETKKDDFPEMWEGVYWRFHYLNMARENHAHAAEVSSRRKSKSYTLASMLSKMISLGINEELHNKRACSVVASNKDYLIKKGQGVLEKFEINMDFISKNTQFPSSMSQKSISNMQWTVG